MKRQLLFSLIVIVMLFSIVQTERKLAASELCSSWRPGTSYLVEAEVVQVNVSGVGVIKLVNSSERLQLKAERLAQGQKLRVEGVFREFMVSQEFNYRAYQQGQFICGELAEVKIEPLGQQPRFRNTKDKLRLSFINRVKQQLPQAEAALVIASFLGETGFFEPELADQFKLLGISHVVAVSGANFSLSLGLVLQAARRLSYQIRLLLVVIIGVCYLLLVGEGNLPALRAFSFMLVQILQLWSGHKFAWFNALILALGLIWLINPLFYRQLSFQLSFLAWATMKLFLPRLAHSEELGEAIKAEFMTAAFGSFWLLPWTLLFFGEVNLLSVGHNLLLVPVFTLFYLLTAGYFVASVSQIPLMLAFVEQLCWLGAEFILRAISFLSRFNLSLTLNSQPGQLLILAYGLLLIIKLQRILNHGQTKRLAIKFIS